MATAAAKRRAIGWSLYVIGCIIASLGSILALASSPAWWVLVIVGFIIGVPGVLYARDVQRRHKRPRM